MSNVFCGRLRRGISLKVAAAVISGMLVLGGVVPFLYTAPNPDAPRGIPSGVATLSAAVVQNPATGYVAIRR